MGTQGDPRQPKSPRHGPPTAGFFLPHMSPLAPLHPTSEGGIFEARDKVSGSDCLRLGCCHCVQECIGCYRNIPGSVVGDWSPCSAAGKFSEEFSSRVTLPLPKSLQRELSLEAEHEDCSLNQHIINALCERRGALAQTSIQAVSGLHKFRHPNRKRNFATFDLFTPVPVWKAPDGQSNRPNQECSSCKEAAGMISGPL